MQGLPATCCSITPTTSCVGTPITQADVGQFGYEITTPGTYCVQENLQKPSSNPSQYLIGIQVDNVTLDLNGYTLDGDGASFVITINGGLDNVILRNGVMRSGTAGFFNLGLSSTVLIQDIRVIF